MLPTQAMRAERKIHVSWDRPHPLARPGIGKPEHQQSETIGPDDVHGREHEKHEEDKKIEEGALFGAQVHENKDHEESFDAAKGQHAYDQCSSLEILVADEKLKSGDYNQGYIDGYILLDSLCLSCRHVLLRVLLP